LKKYKIAEGGFARPTKEHIEEVYKNNPEMHGDGDDEKQDLNMTQPFVPERSSTPHPGGEQIEMKTIQHEQTGLPSYAETSFGGDDRTPLLTDDYISRRLDSVKRNSGTRPGFLTFQKLLINNKSF